MQLEAELKWLHIAISYFFFSLWFIPTIIIFKKTTKLISFCIQNQYNHELINNVILCAVGLSILVFRIALYVVRKKTKRDKSKEELLFKA